MSAVLVLAWDPGGLSVGASGCCGCGGGSVVGSWVGFLVAPILVLAWGCGWSSVGVSLLPYFLHLSHLLTCLCSLCSLLSSSSKQVVHVRPVLRDVLVHFQSITDGCFSHACWSSRTATMSCLLSLNHPAIILRDTVEISVLAM